MLGQPGSWHMHAMLQAQYHHPHPCSHIEQCVCEEYQHTKSSGPDHGLLPDQNIAGAH